MVDAEFFIHHWFPQKAQEKSFVARRQPTTPQAILTSISTPAVSHSMRRKNRLWLGGRRRVPRTEVLHS